MAESESGADKSEEPTSKRLEEARQKGQIARSKELGTLAVTFGGAAPGCARGQRGGPGGAFSGAAARHRPAMKCMPCNRPN